MASYRPIPAQSTFPPPPMAPPPPQQQQRPNQYNQNYNQMAPAPALHASSSFQKNYPRMPPRQNFPQHYPHTHGQQSSMPLLAPHQQYQYQPPPPTPPPPAADSAFPPPPPPPSPSQQQQHNQVYNPPTQYPQYGHLPMQPPPPPLPPLSPGSSMPPPPPPSSPPPPTPKESRLGRDKGVSKDRREHGRLNHGVSNKQHQQKPPASSVEVKKVNGQAVRVETEEERRLRKRKEYEKQQHDDKRRHQLKESQNSVMQKAQAMSSQKGHDPFVGSQMGDRRATTLLSSERIENRLKKPTTFLCKLKFRNELPDPSAQPKLMKLKRDEDRFTRYTITSLEKNYKPQLYVEPDLGIPLDLLDLSVYNPSGGSRLPFAPEDEELLHDDEAVTPVKKDGIRRKERPTDKGVAWLVKTQYISSISAESTKQSLTEKQAKELREMKGGRNLLENLNDRERQIKEIKASFEACKLPPVHGTNKHLRPVEVLPLLPDFDRYEDKFVMVGFDSAPTADSEAYSKLDQSIRDACESRAVMKACVVTGSDPANPEKFLAFMVPSPNELSKDMYDENEHISYSWLREYHWDLRGDDANDPTTFLVTFDEVEAHYAPLPTKISLRKKRATEGRSGDEIEHFPVPSQVTVRRRSTAATIEQRDSWVNPNSRGHVSKISRYDDDDDDYDDVRGVHGVFQHQDINHSSGTDDDLSE